MLLVSVLAGCSREKENDATKDQPVQNDPTSEPSDEPTSQPTDEAPQGYVPENDLEITIWNTQGEDYIALEKPKEDIPGDWLANKTKVRISDFYGNGGQQWESKLTILVAGDTLPDLVLTQAKQGLAHHAKLHEGDLNWELTPEMLQQYAPDVWNSVPDFIWESMKIDGKIYGIPFAFDVDKEIDPDEKGEFYDTFSRPKNTITWSGDDNITAVRDDILKTLIPSAMNYEEAMQLVAEKNDVIGEELILPIKSTEEYIKFMYDIKALGLKIGNKPVYATGFDGGDNWMALSTIGSEILGYKNYNYTGWMNIPEKKMSFGYIDPIFKEAAKNINQMINDNVIDPESLVHNAEKFKEKVMNGQYAIVAINWVQGIDVVNAELEQAGKEFRFVPFYTQVPNREGYPQFKEGPPMFNEALSLMKTLSEDELIQTLNWINTMFTEEWEEIRYWGTPEADLYTVNADGTRTFKDANLNKLCVDGDMTAMDWREAKGLNNSDAPFAGGSPGFWHGVTKWNNTGVFNPRYVNNKKSFTTIAQAMGFKSSSKYCQGFVPVPNIQSWSAEYANIPEVQELWSTRATWDDPFKISLTAKNEEDFNKKWDSAIDNFKKTLDVDKMLEEQTKIMLPLLEKRQTN